MTLICVAFVTYRKVFHSLAKKNYKDRDIPDSDQYKKYEHEIYKVIDNLISQKYEEVSILSHDGLRLFGRYYHIKDDAPLVILFHGYRSTAMRDCGGAFKMCNSAGYNMLIIDQRAHGKSEGHTMSFGIKERYDCLRWANYASNRFGENSKIILYGVSMGAATVLMASDLELPKNVVGIIADCGYTSPKEIICKVCREMRLPPVLTYPFIKLGAFIFGGFNLDGASAVSSLKKCKVPVLFVHGEDDMFVPCDMGRENYESCASEKQLLTIPTAGHAMSYFADNKLYVETVQGFMKRLFQ